MNDFLKDIIKITGNEYADLVSEGVAAGDVDNFVDTGSYVFNALLSGSLYGGLPANKHCWGQTRHKRGRDQKSPLLWRVFAQPSLVQAKSHTFCV